MDVVSYLMGNTVGGGGGEEKSLFSSGWIQKYDNVVTVDGNTINLNAGSTSHSLYLAPPANVNKNNRFNQGDVWVVAITVKEVSGRFSMGVNASTSTTVSSAKGLFTADQYGNAYTNETGDDVLTFTTTGSYNANYILSPGTSGGSSSSSAKAVVEITGMSFNGTVIFGSVTPPNL